ncbi:MAG: hypothetical protein K6C08_11185 [Oscillospiraceae bacterium]|nr:hypothetical protein [Oscillospiraceae bacterium]
MQFLDLDALHKGLDAGAHLPGSADDVGTIHAQHRPAVFLRQDIVYMQAEKPSVNPRVILLAAFSAVGVLLIALFLTRQRKRKSKPKSKKTKRRVK